MERFQMVEISHHRLCNADDPRAPGALQTKPLRQFARDDGAFRTAIDHKAIRPMPRHHDRQGHPVAAIKQDGRGDERRGCYGCRNRRGRFHRLGSA